jgi:predicted lipoprotein with Yx(FWY)xxD motif
MGSLGKRSVWRRKSVSAEVAGARGRKRWGLRLLPVGLVATSMALPAAAHASTVKPGKTPVVMSAKRGQFGTILVTTTGATLYEYQKDTKNHSSVTGPLLAHWPALVVRAGATPVGKGITGLGVIRRSNGQEQVTYRGKPLYRFVQDTKSGEVTGQGVHQFFIVKLGSSAMDTKTTASKPPASSGIPQHNGGDGDSDNNGGPSDGDGNL